MLKIVYPICCGMDVYKNFIVALHCNYRRQEYNHLQKADSLPSPTTCAAVLSGLLKITAPISAWNLRGNIGFLSTTHWNLPVKSFSLTRNMRNQSEPRSRTKRIPSGLLTALSTALFPAVLFLQRIFVSSGTWLEAQQFHNRREKTALKTILPCPTSNWIMCFRMFLAKQPLQSLLTYSKIQSKNYGHFSLSHERHESHG